MGFAAAASAAAIEFRTAYGGPNVAVGGTPAASNQGQAAVANAFDGNPSTSWITADANFGTHWVSYDFGTPVEINEVVWSKRPDSFGVNEAPTYGDVQYSSNNVLWTTHWSFVNWTPWATGAETRVYSRNTPLPFNRHWRIVVDKTGFSEFDSVVNTSLSEVEMRIVAGGADRCVGGVANSFAGSAANAFDNDNATIWNPSMVPPFPIQYSFAASENIIELALRSRGDNFMGDAPTEFTLQRRDGPTANVRTFRTGPWGRGEQRIFNVNTYVEEPERFVRIRPLGVHGGAGSRFSCAAVEFRTSVGGPNIATGGTPFARDHEGSNFSANAFDGNLSTRYAANLVGQFPKNYIGYHLPTPIGDEVVQVAITCTNETFGPNEAPTGFRVEYGIGNVWTLLWEETGIPAWTQGQTRVFTKP